MLRKRSYIYKASSFQGQKFPAEYFNDNEFSVAIIMAIIKINSLLNQLEYKSELKIGDDTYKFSTTDAIA